MPGMPVPGAEGQPPIPGMPDAQGNIPSPLDPNTMAGSLAAAGQTPMPPEPSPLPADAGVQNTALAPQQQASIEPVGFIETKEDNVSLQRWTAILNRAFERLVERQQRVTLEKLSGTKSKRAIAGNGFVVESIFNSDIWDKQFDEDIRPVLSTIIYDGLEFSEKSLNKIDIVAQLDAQIERFKQVNDMLYQGLNSAYISSLHTKDADKRNIDFRARCVAMFSSVLAKTVNEVSVEQARIAWSFAN